VVLAHDESTGRRLSSTYTLAVPLAPKLLSIHFSFPPGLFHSTPKSSLIGVSILTSKLLIGNLGLYPFNIASFSLPCTVYLDSPPLRHTPFDSGF
jgi:hypothetical protein